MERKQEISAIHPFFPFPYAEALEERSVNERERPFTDMSWDEPRRKQQSSI